MATIIDYSAGYPGAPAVRSAGHAGVIRYLRKEGSSGVRPITVGEFDDMQRNGRTVALVYQHVSKSRVTQGFEAGQHDARWARARALELGGGEPRAIYFAVDYDAPTGDWGRIRQYMLGAANVLGTARVGTYGKWALLNYLFADNTIAYGWQTYAWSPGHNKDPKTFHPRANLFQRLAQPKVNGIAVDVNDILKADYGQYGFKGEDEMNKDQSDKLDAVFNMMANRGASSPGIYEFSRATNAMVVDLLAAQSGEDVDKEWIESTMQKYAADPVAIAQAIVPLISGMSGEEMADAFVARVAEHLGKSADEIKGTE